ncbi:hypothetical protein [Furfurilactobacillus milii]|uniref:PvuRts1 I-like SET and RING associated domain-containing protein n=1 Tax=Furfurilactobacillus milii TaxID=2888272 RepID=A0A6N9I3J7_9LACO|nr:hypothetical protein [Furfurilactobacillus milii]MYV17551.1 hypothetical protein [Furfurilactobacillus milii]
MTEFEKIAQVFSIRLKNPIGQVYASLPNSTYKIWMPWLDNKLHGQWLNEWDESAQEIRETNEDVLLKSGSELKIDVGEKRLVWGRFEDGPKFIGVFQYQEDKSRKGIRIYKKI